MLREPFSWKWILQRDLLFLLSDYVLEHVTFEIRISLLARLTRQFVWNRVDKITQSVQLSILL